ncbi:hypothetical protein [Streptomyces sp. NPDC050388]|uniref:hypothetical protein n=1 Tax=Streptomyces sp. NPDC050388 TaxID=3155781 RepID=UPI0034284E8B
MRGLELLTQVMAPARSEHGITVGSVAPDGVATPTTGRGVTAERRLGALLQPLRAAGGVT